MKQQYDKQTWELITRVISGEADAAEQEKFSQWLKDDEANARFYSRLKASWDEEPDKDAANAAFMFGYESGVQKLRDKVDDEEGVRAVKPLKTYELPKRSFAAWKIVAAVLFIAAGLAVFGLMRYWSPPMTTYKTTAVDQRIIPLPDGSSVRLNSNSRIAFVKGFHGSTRKVNLTGEAFFKVKHNEKKPFIIHVGDAIVQDVGTAFNVKEEPDGAVVVAVKQVAASIRHAKNKSQSSVLRKNQVGVVRANVLITHSPEDIQNYFGWITHRIVFKNEPLFGVAEQLDHIYGLHDKIADASLKKLKLTAYIKNTSLHDVLHMIALSLDISYTKKGNTVIWKK